MCAKTFFYKSEGGGVKNIKQVLIPKYLKTSIHFIIKVSMTGFATLAQEWKKLHYCAVGNRFKELR